MSANRDRRPLLPFFALAVTAAMWGAWWIPLRHMAERGVPPAWATAAFGTAAMVLLLPVAWRHRRRLWRARGALAASALVGGLSSVAYNYAVVAGDIVRVSLLFYLTPVWASILGTTVLGERLGSARAVSIALGFAGAVSVLGFENGLPLPRTLADWMGLASGLLWAVALTVFRKARDVPALDKGFALMAGSVIAGLALAQALPGEGVPDPRSLLPYLPYILAVAAFWLVPMTVVEMWGASRVDPGRAAVVLLTEVGSAALTATLIAGEAFGWREGLGCLFIVAAGLVELRAHLNDGAARTRASV